jgi:hypothetical protein
MKIEGLRGETTRSEFDLMTIPKHPRLTMRSAHPVDIDDIYQLISANVPGNVAPPRVIRLVMMHNRNSVMVFDRHGEIVGVYANLMLTALGLERLLTNEFSGLDPDFNCLAPRLMAPAAIYQWMIVAPGIAAEGLLHMSAFLQRPFYRHANLFGRPVTEGGMRFARSTGFKPLGAGDLGDLYRYTRLANRGATLKRAA